MVNFLEKVQQFIIKTNSRLNEPLPWKKKHAVILVTVSLILIYIIWTA